MKYFLRSLFFFSLLFFSELNVFGQVTIGIHDFETTNASPAMTRSTATTSGSPSVSAVVTGNSPSSNASPASSPYFTSSNSGYRHAGPSSGSTAAIVTHTFSAVDTRNYTNVSVSIRVASMSIGSGSNGIESDDYCEIAVSPDNGVTWYQQSRVIGATGNTRWAFSGTGTGTRAYLANNFFTNHAVVGGGLITGTNAITTLTVTGLPAVQNLRIRVQTRNDSGNESWIIDDVRVTGIPPVFWDTNGATAGSGNAGGNWNENKWSSSSNGTLASTAYTNGSTPTFSAGTDGIGTFSVNVDAAVNANGISFEEGTVTLGASTGTLTLTGATVTVASGATGIIEEPVLGSLGLTKQGTGLLTLTGANTYTNGTTISAGTLQIGNGGTTGSVDGDIAKNGNLIFDRSNDYTYGGTITGTNGTLTKRGAGILRLSATNNSFTGGINIEAGIIRIGVFSWNLNLPNASNPLTLNGGNLQVGDGSTGLGGTVGTVAVGFTVGANGGSYINSQNIAGTLELSGAITNNSGGTLTLQNTTQTNSLFSGVISGNGSVIINNTGTGITTFTANNTYTGNTTISAGTLALSGSGAIASSANISIASGANFNLDAKTANVALGASQILSIPATGANTTATITVGSNDGLTLGSTGGIIFTAYGGANGNSSTNAPLTVTGSTTAGALALNIAPVTITTTTALTAGTYVLIAKSGSATGVTGTPSTLTVNGSGLASGYGGSLSVDGDNRLILTVVALSGNIWDANGTTAGSGNTGGNWSEAKWTNSIAGTTATNSFTNNSTPTFSAGTDGTGTFTVAVDATVNANGISFEEGTVTLGASTGALTLTGATVTVASDATGIIEEPVLGNVGITKAGDGLLKLTADNNGAFTGNININSGVLESDGSALFANQQTSPLNNRPANIALGATLRLRNTLGLDPNPYPTYSGAISGAGTLEKIGPGRISLGGNNNAHTGDVIINGGDLDSRTGQAIGDASRVIINSPNNIPSESKLTVVLTADETVGTIEGNGTIDFYGAGNPRLILSGNTDRIFSGQITGSASAPNTDPISGTGVLIKNGTGALTLSGANSFTGGITLNSGTLNLQNASALGTGRFYINGGNIDVLGSNLTISNNLHQTWGGNFTFIGTYDLNIGNNSTGTVTLTGNRIVTVSNNNLIVQGAIAGAYSLTKAGAGTLRLRGNSNYSGGTTVSVGALLATGLTTTGSNTGEGTVVVQSGATIGGTQQIGFASTGPVTINNGGKIAPGAFAIGTLTAKGNVTINGTFEVEHNATTTDRLNVVGNLVLGSTSVLNFVQVAALNSGTYIIAQYGTLTGTFANVVNLPAGYEIDYNYLGQKEIVIKPATTSITTTSASYGPFCNAAANNISVAFTSSGAFTGTFSVQLSDENGNFPANHTDNLIGSGTSPITATIPANQSAGSGYRVRVVNNNPITIGTNNGSAIEINANPTASPNFSTNPICAGGSTTLSANATAGSGSISNYAWSSGITGNNSSGSVSGAGTYTVTVTNSNGCTVSTTSPNLTLNANPTASPSFLTNPICAGGSTTLSANATAGSGSISNYAWSSGITGNNASGSVSGAGTYTVTVTNSNGCTVSATSPNLTVNANPTASPNYLTNPICAGGSTTLSANATAGSGSISNYAWSSGITGNNASGSVSAAGTYTVTVTNSNGCTVSATSPNLTVNTPPATPTFTTATTTNNNATPCLVPNTYTINAQSGYTYSWSVPAGWGTVSGGTTNQITVTPSLATGAVSVSVSIAGCSPATNSINVTPVAIPAAPVANSNTTPQTTSVGVNDFIANWNSVSGATNYNLEVSTVNTFVPGLTIAEEGFDNALTLFTNSGGTYFTGNSASGDRPASSPFASNGTHSFGVSNGTAILTSSNINTSNYTNTELSFRLASFSIGSTGNGADGGDIVTVEISPNGGTNYYSTVRVLGNSNAYWAYSTGTGVATTTYDGNTSPVDFAPSGGGDRTTDGYSTIKVTDLPAVNNLIIRVTILNDNTAERWVIDNLTVKGNLIYNTNNTTQSVTGLEQGTTYYYRVSATNACGTSANSNVVAVTTLNPITTGIISGSPFCAGATVNVPFTIGTTFNSGNVFTAQLSNASGSFASPVNIGTLSQTSAGTIIATIPSNTVQGTGYRIRVVSSNPVYTGTVNSANLTINAITTPSVTTNAATSVTSSGAQLNGNVTADGCTTVTVRGFVYSKTDNTPTIGETGVTNVAAGSGTGTYNTTLNGLDCSATYYFRAYATNSQGTVYGNTLSFFTDKTIIAIQDFEASPATPTWGYSEANTNGTPYSYGIVSGSNGGSPATPYYTSGSRGYRIQSSGSSSNGGLAERTLTFDAVNTLSYTNVEASFRVAGMSENTSNGIDPEDNVRVEISPDGGTTWYYQSKLTGSSYNNVRWAFTGTGSASRSYLANNSFSSFNVVSSTDDVVISGNNAITTIKVTNLPAASNLRIRIILSLTNGSSDNEFWVIDDVKIVGCENTCTTPDAIAFINPPSSVLQDATMSAVTVRALCTSTGQTATNYNSDITLTASNGGCGYESQTVTAVNGIATFSNIVFTRSAQSNITLTASANGFTNVVSSTFNVTAPAGGVTTIAAQNFSGTNTLSYATSVGGSGVFNTSNTRGVSSTSCMAFYYNDCLTGSSGASSTVTFGTVSGLNTYTSKKFKFRLALGGEQLAGTQCDNFPTSGFGMDVDDFIRLEVSINGGSYVQTFQMNGFSNLQYGFNNNALTINYNANQVIGYTTEPSVFIVSIPDNATSAAFRFTLKSNRRNEIWYLDDLAVEGNTAGTPLGLPIVNAGNDFTGCPSGPSELLGSATNTVGDVVIEWSPATTLSNAAIFNPIASNTSAVTYTLKVTDEDGCEGTDQVTVSVLNGSAGLWTGAKNQNWFECKNWANGIIPDVTTNVTIPDVTNDPEIALADATTNNITFVTGSNLFMTTDDSELEVYGNWTNNSGNTLSLRGANDATVVFKGVSSTQITGNNETYFQKLEVENPTLSINANADVADLTTIKGGVDVLSTRVFKSKKISLGNEWKIVDDFNSLNLANLDGQNDWFSSGATVVADPANAFNQVLSIAPANTYAYKELFQATANSVHTVFYRIRIDNIDNNSSPTPSGESAGFGGISDAATPTAFGNYRVQNGVNPGFGTPTCDPNISQATSYFHCSSSGSTINKFLTDNHPVSDTWYNLWFVIDNDGFSNGGSAQYRVYIQGGAYTSATLLQWSDPDLGASKCSNLITDLSLRGSGSLSNSIISKIFFRTGAAHQSPLYFDDVYFSEGINISNPCKPFLNITSGSEVRVNE